VLAIAFVVAGGVATLVLAVGSHHSLDETRIAYTNATDSLTFSCKCGAAQLCLNGNRGPSGVAVAEGRITELALLDIPNFREPATGELISILRRQSKFSTA